MGFKVFQDEIRDFKDEEKLFRRVSRNTKHTFEQITIEDVKASLHKQSIYELNYFIFNKKYEPIGGLESYDFKYVLFTNEFKKILKDLYVKNKEKVDCDDEEMEIEIGF